MLNRHHYACSQDFKGYRQAGNSPQKRHRIYLPECDAVFWLKFKLRYAQLMVTSYYLKGAGVAFG
jgi:hypothetical protein